MLKKIVPIVALIGASALVVGISNTPTQVEKKEAFITNINAFKNDLENYSETSNVVQTAMNKYMISLENENLDDLQNIQTLEETEYNEVENNTEINDEKSVLEETIPNHLTKDIQEEDLVDQSITQTDIDETITLYSLSSDIENSCDDFCLLKENISKAIVETQNLIEKVQKKEIELTDEQRLYISEQAQQLKNLGRQLSNVTTELSFNLSDINTLMLSDNNNFNSLSMKYLVVLDNLVNGNEMLQSGLNSLNLINQMFNMNSNTIPPNNKGRILYGFKQNNENPIIKDYYINNDGELVDNSQNSTTTTPDSTDDANKNQVVDTYQNNKLKSNIDTYNNTNLPNNIDSFFNTALLDNQFMYGNVHGNNLAYNPYMNGIAYQNQPTNGVENKNNTQDTDNETKKEKREKRKFQLKKNIDTFKDENEPDIKTKLGNIKNSISSFFGLNEKIENPVSRYNPSDSD